MPITAAHWVFLFTVAAIIFVMVVRRNVAIVAIAGTVALAFMSANAGATLPDRMIFATQSLFRAILMAGIGLFDIMLLVALMLAMLKAMSKEGADELMIIPVRRLIVGPRSAFITLACTTYVCGIFFWPSPATALVGTVLVPVAIRARLPAIGAVAAVNIAGHGMALSSDPVIQAATRISAGAAHVSPGLVLFYTVLFAGVVGVIALTVFGLLLGRDMRRGKVVASASALPLGDSQGRSEFGPHARFLAILTPSVLFGMGALIISRALFDPAHAIYGGDATALLGGCAVCILIIACVVHDGHHALEQVIVH
ncbi:MAG: hypothetical protein PHE36_14705, partial [Novosphingobium sp.]|nr:hypothetical protein [Novosphingobium sp.]